MGALDMTPADLKATREYLGLSGATLAAYLEVDSRTLRHWEHGDMAISSWAVRKINRLVKQTDSLVDELVQQMVRAAEVSGSPVTKIKSYRTDEEYLASGKGDARMSASWHRQICARVARQLPGSHIVFDLED